MLLLERENEGLSCRVISRGKFKPMMGWFAHHQQMEIFQVNINGGKLIMNQIIFK